MTRIKTFTPDNKFRFACPVFGAEVEMAGCLNLREEVARGKRPEERRGCQACMRASKCPIPRLVQVTARTGEDHYYASEPRVGQLRSELLDNIAPIVVPEHLLTEMSVPESEREIILALNANIAAGRKGKAKAVGKIELEDLPKRKRIAAAPTADEQAAMTGDMSAAIRKAVAKAKAEGAPPAKPDPDLALADAKARQKGENIDGSPRRETIAEKSPQKPAGGDSAPKVQSPRPPPPTPPAANVASPVVNDLAKSPHKAPSLLELARMKRAAATMGAAS